MECKSCGNRFSVGLGLEGYDDPDDIKSKPGFRFIVKGKKLYFCNTKCVTKAIDAGILRIKDSNG